MRYLLDTNAVSEPQRRVPDPGYLEWLASREPMDLAISTLTFGELKRGVAALDAGRRRVELSAWLSEWLSTFGDRILPVDLAVASAWAEVSGLNRRVGRPIGVIDELIAATALAHRLIVVTRNVRHFETSGCEVVAPWAG